MTKEELEELGIQYRESDLWKEDKKRQDGQLKIRDDFVKQFSLENLRKMTIDDYVEGKGSKTSFCYLIEVGMQWLGQIRGSFTNSKFVLHYDKTKKTYSFESGKFGRNLEDVFSNVKAEIIKLVEDGKNNNIKGLENNKLSPMFKGKLYYVYYPDKTLPIYNIDHVNFFLNNLGLNYQKDVSYFVKIKQMMDWKQKSSIFNQYSNLEFMSFLYSIYGFKKEIDILKGKNAFNDVVVEYIKDKDVIDRYVKESSKTSRTPNFEEINRKKSAIGMNGEMFVLNQEKKNNSKYSRRIMRVGDDPSFGYDIRSYDANGNEKHIEVKTCSFGNLGKIDFYISSNEYSKLQSDPLYAIYYVCGLSSKNPKIIILNKENLIDVTYEPIAYKIKGKLKD